MLHPPLLHSIFGSDGAAAIVVEVAGTFALMLHITALVVLSESGHDTGTKWRWAAGIVFVPLLGPLAYLVHDREALRLPARA